MTEQLNKYRVHMRSRISPEWAFYDGHVDVFAEDETQAQDRAIDKLCRGSFRDRGRDAWIIEKVERI
jgi:hypothetical protein